MVKLFLAAAYSAVVTAILSLPATVSATNAATAAAEDMVFDAKAQSIVDGFSIAQVIGQMTQVDISTVMNPKDNTLNEDWVRLYAQQYVGSYLNTIWDEPKEKKYGWTASEFRSVVKRIQEISMEENGGHPIIYGLDSVHGANYAGRITARDTQAAGIPWIFGPILEISQNPLWSRTYETFGEDPYWLP
ncbi:hypothetical protein PInf_013113 [Phytophthora infestans]|nr:hypothetical protein PInf_013113 [Phytophthora infestans]